MPHLIVFSHLRWNFVFQRPQHLLSRLARHYAVIFVEGLIITLLVLTGFRKAVFRHVWSSGCSTCHKAPGGHRGGACESCHRNAGRSWAFSHPTSTSCASCHRAPANHYGTSCRSCHGPSRAWSNATFSHPQLREHTYRSFACSSCHPSGYASASCTSCHKSGAPSGD